MEFSTFCSAVVAADWRSRWSALLPFAVGTAPIFSFPEFCQSPLINRNCSTHQAQKNVSQNKSCRCVNPKTRYRYVNPQFQVNSQRLQHIQAPYPWSVQWSGSPGQVHIPWFPSNFQVQIYWQHASMHPLLQHSSAAWQEFLHSERLKNKHKVRDSSMLHQLGIFRLCST